MKTYKNCKIDRAFSNGVYTTYVWVTNGQAIKVWSNTLNDIKHLIDKVLEENDIKNSFS
jgi:hypothetical protein